MSINTNISSMTAEDLIHVFKTLSSSPNHTIELSIKVAQKSDEMSSVEVMEYLGIKRTKLQQLIRDEVLMVSCQKNRKNHFLRSHIEEVKQMGII